jgi:hypothetical protein
MRAAMVISLVDQAVLSGFNLSLSLVLIAHAPPSEFGQFSYALAVLLIMGSLHNALIGTPIGVALPGRSPAEQNQALAMLLRIDHGLRLGLVPVVGVLLAVTSRDPLFLSGGLAMCYFALWRETQRGRAFAAMAAHRALILDAVAVGVSVLAGLLFWQWLPPVPALLFAIASGNALAVLAAGHHVPLLGLAEAFGRYRQIWTEARWSLLGAVTTEAQYRGYVFAVETLRGTDTLGAVQAGRALMGPLQLIATAWGRVARPEMTKALFEGRAGAARRILALGTLGVCGLCLVYLGLLYLAWPQIEARLFHGRYPDVGLMTAAWGLATLVSMSQICLGYYLQAARLFRPLAFVSVGAAAASGLALLGLASAAVPPVYAVFAVLIGEITAVIWILVLVLRHGAAPAATPLTVSP